MSEVIVEYIWTLGGAQFLIQQGILILYGLILGGMAYKHGVRRKDCDQLRERLAKLQYSHQNLKSYFKWSLTATEPERKAFAKNCRIDWTDSSYEQIRRYL